MIKACYLFVCLVLALTYVAAVYISDIQGRHIPHVLEDSLIQALFIPAVFMVGVIEIVVERL